MSALLREAEEDESLHYLEQFSNMTDLVLKNIEDTVHLLSMNSAFTEYQRFPDKPWFQKFHDHYDLERITEYSRFLNLRAGINRNLEQFATTSEFIQSVYFFDPQVREVFSLEYIPSPIQKFGDREWYTSLPGMREPGIVGPVLNRNRQQVLYLVYPSPGDEDMVFIVNLNLTAFYRFLWNRIQPRNTHLVFIQDAAGKPLVYNPADEKVVHSLAWSLNRKEEGLREVVLDRRTLLVSSRHNALRGWTFHALNDRDEFAGVFMENRQYMVLILVPLSVVILVLLLILRKELYSPISRVMDRIEPDEEESERLGDLERLEHWMDHTATEKVEREMLLARTLPAYQVSFLNRMLEGGEQVPPALEAAEELRQLDLPLAAEGLRVVCLFPDDPDQLPALLNRMALWCGDFSSGAVCLRRNRLVTVVADPGDLSYGDLCGRLDTLLARIAREESWKAYGAVSPDCWSVTDLSEGFRQAERGLRDYLKVPFGTPLAEIGRPGGTGLSALTLPDGLLDGLLNRLREGERAPAEELLDNLFEKLETEGREHPPGEVQHFYIRLVSDLLSRLRDRGYDLDFIDSDGSDLFVSLIRQQTREGIRRWIFSLMSDLERVLSSGGSGSTARA